MRPARAFRGDAHPEMTASAAELAAAVHSGALASGATLLVDARGADRFAGQNETLDPVAGHIPGARNHPFAGNLDADGRFLAGGTAARALAGDPCRTTAPATLVAMCGSGVTACHNLLALEVAGLPRRAAVRGLLERVDPRSGASGRARRVNTRKCHAQF